MIEMLRRTSKKPVSPVVKAFYTVDQTVDHVIKLWVSQKAHRVSDVAPDFDGEVDGQRVIAYIKNGMNGPFVSIVKAGRVAIGSTRDRVGVARIHVMDDGRFELLVQLDCKNERIPLQVSMKTPDEILVRLGLK